jgi:hypothetical protein
MNKSKTLRVITGVVLAMLIAAKLPAQNPDLLFEQPFPYPMLHATYLSFAEKPYCYVTEVAPNGESDGFCLVTVNHDKSCFFYETESVYPPLVYKVSRQGELLGELKLGYDDRYAFVHNLYQAPDDPQCFLAIGRVHDNDLHYDRPFMVKFDHELNLLWKREVELPEPYRNYISFGSVMDSDGNFFCSSYLYDCSSGSPYSRFYFRLTPEGELDGINDLPIVSDFQTVFEYPDGSGDYGLLENVGLDNQSEMILLRVNKNMELVGQMTIPNIYTEKDPTNTYNTLYFALVPPQFSTSGRHAVASLPDGSLILANEATVSYQKRQAVFQTYRGTGFLWVNPEGESVACAMDYKESSNDSLTMIVPTLPVSDNSFYFVYNMGQNFGYDYMNCFVVGKMDWEGNLLWRRYWNRYTPEYDMKIYYPQDAIVCHDGGCLITGFSFKSNINVPSSYTYEPDVFLLKFFADGTLNVPKMESQIRPYTFWPNPASDILRLEFSPDVQPMAVELYDVQGRLLSAQSSDLENISVEGLTAGIYTMRVVMKDGSSFSDKVVKQ